MRHAQAGAGAVFRFELVDMRSYKTVAVVEAKDYAQALARAHQLEQAGFVSGVAVSVNPLGAEVWNSSQTYYDGFFEDEVMLH